MESHTRDIGQLFVDKIHYIIPIFQRHYVWNEKDQWIPLWEDIRDQALERLEGGGVRPHFFGSLVLVDTKQLTTTQSIKTFIVIDGQQRLTTLQLILCAICEVCRRYEQDELVGEIENYLLNKSSLITGCERYKLWPTRSDQKTYKDVLTLSFDEFQKKHDTENIPGKKKARKKKMRTNPILGAYLFFENTISNFVREMSDNTADDKKTYDAVTVIACLFKALIDDLKIVEIQLQNQDDPQMIFETLNARGTPLSHADLIRNYIFMRSGKSVEDKVGDYTAKLYDNHWAELEDEFWSQEAKQGRRKKPRLVFFFYNYLLYKTGTPMRLNKIFPTYKKWIEGSKSKPKPFSSLDAELEDIERASQIYKILTQDKDEGIATQDEGERILSDFAKQLRRWDITTIYPLIFAIELDGNLDDEERAGIYTDLDSYLVRRMVCNKTQKDYNKGFLSLSKRLQEKGINRKNLQTLLLLYNVEMNIWPSDGEFEKEWLKSPVYQQLGSSVINGILTTLEQEGRTRFSEDISINSKLSIEHVMPSKWYKYWPLDDRTVSKKEWGEADQRQFDEDNADIYKRIYERKQLLHTFGNLTLLTRELNASISSRSFSEKRPEIIKHSELGLNRYFYNVDAWDEEAIRKRGKSLFKLAMQIWPKPERPPDMHVEDEAEEGIKTEDEEEYVDA